MILVLKPLLANAATLIAALFILGQQFVDTPLNHNSPKKTRILAGLMTGVVGSLLVVLGVRVAPKVVVDFRYIALIVSALYGGTLSVAIGAIVIAVFRLFYYGISYAAIIAALFVFSVALGCGIISKFKMGKKLKWLMMVVYCLINSIFALVFVIDSSSKLIRVCTIYCLVFSFISCIVFYYSETISASNELIRKLRMESSRDFLTGLNNVRNFDKLYNAALQYAGENTEALSVVVIDIDYFKRVNDKYGHQAGDAILRQLGQILQQSCRNFDIISRNGGEEFSILLRNCSNKTAYEIAERIRKKVEITRFALQDGKEISITISAGLATFPDTAKDNEALYKNADKALYKAKNSGRNQVYNYVAERSNVYSTNIRNRM